MSIDSGGTHFGGPTHKTISIDESNFILSYEK